MLCLLSLKVILFYFYFDWCIVDCGNGGFLYCSQIDTYVIVADQVLAVGSDIAFDADHKCVACLVRFG